MAKKPEGCAKPAGGPLVPREEKERPAAEPAEGVQRKMLAQVGKEAPDFEATAYVGGGFKNIKLSDYRGKWVALCFYPGDFTFV